MISAGRLLQCTARGQKRNVFLKMESLSGIHIDVKSNTYTVRKNNFPCLDLHKQPVKFTTNFLRFSSTSVGVNLEGLSVPNQAEATTSISTTQNSNSESNLVNDTLNIIDTEKQNIVVDPIPEPPTPEPIIEAVTELLGGEPSFSSLGLGGWSPVGMVENCLEWMHISCELPWWTTIVIGTCVVRILMFPLVILSQRNAAKLNNNLPGMQLLQLKMTEARQRGDRLEAARYGQEMMLFMKEKKVNPLKNMMVPLAQAPLFISFFMSLRGMSNLPVESMKEGGLYWFTDLTVPDEFYILPIITSATLAATIELGIDTGRLQSSNLGLMKYVFRAMPIIIFPFIINFSNAILVYWVSTNFISLIQVGILRIPAVREYFKIEKIIQHDKSSLPMKEKGFVKGVSDSWTNMRLSKELEEREELDRMSFSRAGRGAVVKTYKYDPTRPLPPSPVQAKKRE